MQIEEVITQLEKAETGSRTLDTGIALSLGWKQTLRVITNDTGEETKRYLWTNPATGERVTVPNYTTSTQDAVDLANYIDPDQMAGCARRGSRWTAQMGEDFSYVEGRTAALAICLAAMHYLRVTGLQE